MESKIYNSVIFSYSMILRYDYTILKILFKLLLYFCKQTTTKPLLPPQKCNYTMVLQIMTRAINVIGKHRLLNFFAMFLMMVDASALQTFYLPPKLKC